MSLHAELLPSQELKPSHELLVRLFEENFAEEIERHSRATDEATSNKDNQMRGRIISYKNSSKKSSISGRDHQTLGSNHSQFFQEQSDSFGPDSLLFGRYLTRTLSHSSTTSSLNKSGIGSANGSSFLTGSHLNASAEPQQN